MNTGPIGLVATPPGDRTEDGDTGHDPTVATMGRPGSPFGRALATQPPLASQVVGLVPLPVALLGLGPQAGQPLTQESLIHAAPPKPASQSIAVEIRLVDPCTATIRRRSSGLASPTRPNSCGRVPMVTRQVAGSTPSALGAAGRMRGADGRNRWNTETVPHRIRWCHWIHPSSAKCKAVAAGQPLSPARQGRLR